jgi:hypothetical protein
LISPSRCRSICSTRRLTMSLRSNKLALRSHRAPGARPVKLPARLLPPTWSALGARKNNLAPPGGR